MDENDSFFKLKEQLEDAQKLMGRMEQYIVEARGVLQSCIRRQSEFQYAYLGDMIQETAKTSERLTDKLRRLTFEIVVNPKEYEKYKEDLVLIHGIELEYKDEILRVSAPVLITGKIVIRIIFINHCIPLFEIGACRERRRSWKFRPIQIVRFVLYMFMMKHFRLQE